MEVSPHIKNIRPSYIREILSEATADGVISLAGGLPATDSFPMQLMADSLVDMSNKTQLFQYGQTAGYAPLITCLQRYLGVKSNHALVVCTGSQQALDLVVRTFLQAGEGIALEEPAYLGALQVFALAQVKVEAVTQKESGPDLTALEGLFATKTVKMFYAVPDFHNPSGICWDLDVRYKVAQLCQRYEITLIEDAPYRDLRFAGTNLPMVSSFCPENALVLHSFSKTVAPGIRIGSCSGPREWINEIVKVKQSADLHSSLPMQALLLDILEHPNFSKHLQSLAELYGNRYHSLEQALAEYMPDSTYQRVDGGMFVWLRLSSSYRYLCVMDIAKAAMKEGVAVVPGDVFYSNNIDGASIRPPALRINFSHENEDNIHLAIKRLAATVNACRV